MASTKNYTDDGMWPLQETFIQMMGYGLYKKTFIQMMGYGLYKKHLYR